MHMPTPALDFMQLATPARTTMTRTRGFISCGKAAWHNDAHGFHDAVILTQCVLPTSTDKHSALLNHERAALFNILLQRMTKVKVESPALRRSLACVLQIDEDPVRCRTSLKVAEEELLQGSGGRLWYTAHAVILEEGNPQLKRRHSSTATWRRDLNRAPRNKAGQLCNRHELAHDLTRLTPSSPAWHSCSKTLVKRSSVLSTPPVTNFPCLRQSAAGCPYCLTAQRKLPNKFSSTNAVRGFPDNSSGSSLLKRFRLSPTLRSFRMYCCRHAVPKTMRMNRADQNILPSRMLLMLQTVTKPLGRNSDQSHRCSSCR